MSDTLYPIDEWENDGNAQWLGTESLDNFPEWVGLLLTESIDVECLIRQTNEEESALSTDIDKETTIRQDNEEESAAIGDVEEDAGFGSDLTLSAPIF